jgi:hypothetical protein
MNGCPDGFICINNFHMIYLSIISLMILYIIINQYYKEIHSNMNTIKKIKPYIITSDIDPEEGTETKILKQKQTQLELEKEKQLVLQKELELQQIKDQQQHRDRAVINDPLYPPLKRNYNTPDIRGGIPINIETRESGGDYQQIGILHKKENTDKSLDKPGNNDENIILALYGKPMYRRSQNWLYYVIAERNNIKIPLTIDGVNCTSDNRGCKELMEGDTVTIPQYNGEFQVQIYKFDAPRYIPYVF